MQQNKRKLKPHKLEALTLKLALQASGVFQTKWMVNYNIQFKKSNSARWNFTTDTVHFAATLDRKQNIQ